MKIIRILEDRSDQDRIVLETDPEMDQETLSALQVLMKENDMMEARADIEDGHLIFYRPAVLVHYSTLIKDLLAQAHAAHVRKQQAQDQKRKAFLGDMGKAFGVPVDNG